MDQTENSAKESEGVKVQDRRRFDPDGNPRVDTPENDTNPSPAAASPPAETGPEQGKADASGLQRELEGARKRVDELARGYQALLQDRDEFKQRLTRERERLMDVERANVAQTLLDVVDDLDLSLAAADQSPLAQGVRLIRDGILQKLQAGGIERLEVLGQHFDPNVAEATDMEMTTVPDDDQKMVAEVRAGYRLKDRVIRPARVKVAKYVKPVEA